jgi:hypothetical protein
MSNRPICASKLNLHCHLRLRRCWKRDSRSTQCAAVKIFASISNAGAPSIAKEPSIHAVVSGSRIVPGQIQWIFRDKPLVWSNRGPIVVPSDERGPDDDADVITFDDVLYNKTVAGPIVTGGMASGFIVAYFPAISRDELGMPGNRIVVTFLDVLDNPVSFFHEFDDAKMTHEEAGKFPGDTSTRLHRRNEH